MTTGWRKLADGVYQRSFESWNLNVGLVIGEQRALVVDTRATPREGRELNELVRELTELELVVVNTHAHPDHCWGNEAFPEARTLAHPVAMERMHANPPEVDVAPEGVSPKEVRSSTSFVIPVESVPVSDLVDLGGRSVAVNFHGRGHTGGDLVVEALGTGVAFAGDLIRQDQASWYGDAYPLEWPATLAHMLQYRTTATTWVPGHGLPMSDEEVRTQGALLDEVSGIITHAWYARADSVDTAALLPLAPGNARHAATRGYQELAARHHGVSPTP